MSPRGLGHITIVPCNLSYTLHASDLTYYLRNRSGNQILPLLSLENPPPDFCPRVKFSCIHGRRAYGDPLFGKQPHYERITRVNDIKRGNHGADVGNPEGISLDVFNRDDVEGYPDVLQGFGNHKNSLP